MTICRIFYLNLLTRQLNVIMSCVQLMSLLGLKVAKCQVVLAELVLLLFLVSSLIWVPLGAAIHGSRGL